MDDLIQRLTKELGVNKDQARGGLVALLRAGKQNLAPRDFEQFLASVPGAEQLLKNAAPAGALSSLAGGLGSLLGGKSGAGRWAGLAAEFAGLRIDLGTARKFGPIVIDYVREHGGEDLVGKMRTALNV
jgi:hypothetical protein